MKYRILGRTGLRVSEIGFGCWGIGGGMWKAQDADSLAALKAALELGMNFFDTAFVYGEGRSEKLVAEAGSGFSGLLPAGSPPFTVATKVPPKNGEWPAKLDAPIGEAFPEDYIIDMARKSWENLGRRTIDLLQLHVWTDSWVDKPAWRNAFRKLKADGVADFFGVSVNDHAPGTALELAASGEIDSLQVIYNIFDQSPEDELFDIAKSAGVGIIARVPLDEGSLAGRFTESTTFDDWRKDYFTPPRLKETVGRVEALRWLEKPGRTLAQAALEFCLSNPAVSTVIPGMRKPERVAENAAAAGKTLSPSELREIRKHRWGRDFYG